MTISVHPDALLLRSEQLGERSGVLIDVDIARAGWDLMERRIADPGAAPQRVVLQNRLILRASTAPPRA